MAQIIKNLTALQETWLRSLGQEDPLEKEMATHSSILAWRISWTKEPNRLYKLEEMSFLGGSILTMLINHLYSILSKWSLNICLDPFTINSPVALLSSSRHDKIVLHMRPVSDLCNFYWWVLSLLSRNKSLQNWPSVLPVLLSKYLLVPLPLTL